MTDSPVEFNRRNEYKLRSISNKYYYGKSYFSPENEDRHILPNYIWCFSKSLIHDKNSDVDPNELLKLVKGVRDNFKYLDEIKFPGNLRLVNPSCIWSFDICGPYKSNLSVPPPPSLTSATGAADMVELYNMALLRDVPFSQYNTNPQALKAMNDLNKLSDFKGPKIKGQVVPKTLFRGDTKGDLKGPFVSQFLYLSYKHGVVDVKQKYKNYKPYIDYITDWETAIKLQNGHVVENPNQRVNERYIITLRDGVTYVHLDDPIQSGLQAALILQTLGCPQSSGMPFAQSSEISFIDCAILDIIDLMTRASRISLLTTWYNKWRYLRTRPEAFSMQIHRSKTQGLDLGIHSDVLNSDVLNRIWDRYGSYLLPQAYPEGSPVHPSFPAGHATFASAMVTILKAFFNENHKIDAFIPNEDGSDLVPLNRKLKVRYELDKLASNIALFRNAAGVHYRSDNIGLEIGEHIAIELLKEHIKRYPRKTFFKFHKRNGEKVYIEN